MRQSPGADPETTHSGSWSWVAVHCLNGCGHSQVLESSWEGHSQPLRYLDAHMSRAAEGSYTVWGDFVVFEWDLEIPRELGWNSHGGEAEKMGHRHGN